MMSVMNMASLHLYHGGATLRVVGLVVRVHHAGMFLLAPVFGWLADRRLDDRRRAAGARRAWP
jgi:hypothetical protein